ncbi:MAG: excinuclease ABC subunit UvrA [Proteobacteria bacterium]|nr:excinuclease ABC subunit UvrA [Pseudomonadota bacterium]
MSEPPSVQSMEQLSTILPPPIASIELDGVSTNNLKAVDVAFPLGMISVVTGVSGSGKSSLVFDTLYGEAYRRYVESLSSFARQYLQALPKPDIRAVRHLPPAIAVRQMQSSASNRSTVGTATELTDLLRVLFTHLAGIYCSTCAAPVHKDHPEAVAAHTVRAHDGNKILVCAPLERWGKVAAKDLRAQLEGQGFSRLLTAGGATVKLGEAKVAEFKGAAVVIDRISVGPDSASRLGESLRLAFKVGRGKLWVVPPHGAPEAFSAGLDCPSCGQEYLEPSMALLSFNHPLGACPACQGFGFTSDVDMSKVIPDRNSSLAEAGVVAWNFGAFKEYYAWAKVSAKARSMPFDKPFSDYSDDDWQWLRTGSGKTFDGIDGFFAYLASKKYKAHYRIHAARFRLYVPCVTCGGQRLNTKALACRVQGVQLAQVCKMAVTDVEAWLSKVQAVAESGATEGHQAANDGLLGITEAVQEMAARLTYLRKIGVSYLSLDRAARSLSGGELQRINMARCLGSALTDTLFCLDEPSSGLHARDSGNLLAIIRELRDQGNTVVMVEHERRLIAGADHLVEIGPAAGHAGGRVVYAGAAQLWQRPEVAPPLKVASIGEGHRFIEIKGARTHNLKNLSVRFPLAAITAVCGVSGSGKTSLVQHTLYPLLAAALGQAIERSSESQPVVGGVGPTSLIKVHGEVVLVSQASLGRSSRSNIATYLGLMDEIRKLLAAQPLARKLGLKPGSFSFNTPGGRCETCRGLGTVTEDLSFLGEMEVCCPACSGRRFEDKVLGVEILGKNLIQMLKMTVAEAREFFYDRPMIVKICDQVMGMGMGYLTLGQRTSSFSGGEAQRLKLVSRVRGAEPGKPSILIFDEPTTGLSDSDVANLLDQLRLLAKQGHMVIVVEHHLDVLRSADWLIEIGPEAATAGGELVYSGVPAGLTAVSRSLTRPFLWGP